MSERRRLFSAIRTLYLSMAVLTALYVAGVLVSGALWNHRQGLSLEQRTVSRVWLPAQYRSAEAGVRTDVVVNDAHTFLLFSRAGVHMVDALLAFWGVSLVGAVGLWGFGRLTGKRIWPERPRPAARTIEMPRRGAKIIDFRRK